jgi:hypothetical protein
MVARVQITRFSPVVNRALAGMFRIGLLGDSGLVAAVADGHGNFRAVPLREVGR